MHTNCSKLQRPAVILFCYFSSSDPDTVTADQHLYWLLLHSFSLSAVISPSFSSNHTLLSLCFCSALSHFVIPLSSPPPLLPIIFLGDPRGLCAELTCHESFGQRLLNIPSLPVCLALVITLPLFSLSLSIHLSLVLPPIISPPCPPSVFVFLFLFMMPSVLLSPLFVLVLSPTAGLRCASFTTP